MKHKWGQCLKSFKNLWLASRWACAWQKRRFQALAKTCDLKSMVMHVILRHGGTSGKLQRYAQELSANPRGMDAVELLRDADASSIHHSKSASKTNL